MTTTEMIEKFQCPGCVCGSDTSCGQFELDDEYGGFCDGHVLGTMIGIGNSVALGLPKGFNKPGVNDSGERSRNKINVRFWTAGTAPEWDHLNVAVWAIVDGGFLFVRTYSPRLNFGYVDVIEGGTLEMAENAIDVSAFAGEID